MELQKTRERKINQIRIKVFFWTVQRQCARNGFEEKKEGKYNEAEILFYHEGK